MQIELTSIGKYLILFGTILLITGVGLYFLSKLGFDKLPGDIFIQKGNCTFYFPIVTSILISILITIVLNFFFKK